MKNIYSSKDFSSAPLIKDVDGKKGIVTGYFADFNSIDSDGDIIKPGAFSKTIKENGPGSKNPRIKHLLNHDISLPLGVITSLKEDNKGLAYESRLGTHALGVDFIKMADSGLVTEHSIGYRTIKYNQVKPWDDWKDGEAARELTELKLFEGSSLTAWGANPNTPLTGIKSDDFIDKLLEKSEAIERFCRNSTATDETIELLLIHNKQLLQIISEKTENKDTTEPTITCPHCDNTMSMSDATANDMMCNKCNKPMVKSTQATEPKIITLPDVVECPNCSKHTYNTQQEKGYIKCHRCESVFTYGSKLFVKI